MVALLIMAACSNGSSPGASTADGAGGVEGEIFVSGSSTVEPITNRVAEEFAGGNEGFDYTVEGPGTGDGFAIFCNGETDISDASRPISDEEVAACADSGVEYVELLVAYDGLSVITGAGNADMSCLSFLDLYALLGPESEGFDSWSDANELATTLATELGADFGESHAPYPEAPLTVTAPGEESGTFDSFVELALGDIAEARGQDATSRPDYTASPNDNVIIDGVTDSSLGWVGLAFAARRGRRQVDRDRWRGRLRGAGRRDRGRRLVPDQPAALHLSQPAGRGRERGGRSVRRLLRVGRWAGTCRRGRLRGVDRGAGGRNSIGMGRALIS